MKTAYWLGCHVRGQLLTAWCCLRPSPLCIQKVPEMQINPLNAELNPIRHLLALVGARHIVHVSRIRVNGFTSYSGLGIFIDFFIHRGARRHITSI